MGTILIGNIKGPQGSQGIQGPQGPVGPVGPTGPGADIYNGLDQTEAGVAGLDSYQGRVLDQKKLDVAKVANNLTTAVEGYALDARQGKALDEKKLNVDNVVNNLTTESSGYALDARAGKALSDNINNVNTAVVEMYNSLTVVRSVLTKVPSTVTIGSVNDAIKYGRIVQVSIVFALSQAAAGDTILFTTPYQIRFPFIASIRKDLGGEYLIGATGEDTPNIRALYGEGLPAGTYRGSFIYITT